MAKRTSPRTFDFQNQRKRTVRRAAKIHRRARFELLESRLVLSAAPTLEPIPDVTVEVGAPLHIALDGFDSDGDSITYSVMSNNPDLTGTVLQGNRSLYISVAGRGQMIFELFEQRAPRTTDRIIELAEAGYYDNLLFHRVATYPDGTPFVIQGGDPNGDGTGGTGVDFDDEFHTELQHVGSGILSMAKSSDDTNDSQFFITGSDARHLDFNHSVFGFLNEGESVRQAIQSVEADSNSKPISDVVMESVTVGYDNENGTLMLSATGSGFGEADITVTATDSEGKTAVRTFHVTIQPDSNDAPPFLQEIDWIVTTVGSPTGFSIPATDIEGDSIYYDGIPYDSNPSLSVNVDNSTGYVSITPADGVVGVFGVTVGVRSTIGQSWDVQSVPVLVLPAVPTGIELLSGFDTGSSESDGVTNVNNGSGQPLRFQVSGVIDGAQVLLYADGTLIGSATASGTTVDIITDTTNELADGTHEITAKQMLADQRVWIANVDDTVDLTSELSGGLEIVVDTVDPQITSEPVVVAKGGVEYTYDVESDVESEVAFYRLDDSPSGMVIDHATGVITWTPVVEYSQTKSVTLSLFDLAGNQVSQSFDIVVSKSPIINQIDAQTVGETEELTFTVSTTSTAEPVIYGLGDNAPVGATIDVATGEFAWTPSEGQGPGVYSFDLSATDSTGAVGIRTVTVTVAEANQQPTIDPIENQTVAEGQSFELTVTVGDDDLPVQQVTVELVGDVPEGAEINSETGDFKWRPGEAHGGGDYQFNIRATDEFGGVAEESFSVNVNEVDEPPVVGITGATRIAPGTQLRLKVDGHDPDTPANDIAYSLEGDVPEGAQIDPDSGLIIWNVPVEYESDSAEFNVRVTEVVPVGQAALSTVIKAEVAVVDVRSSVLADSVMEAISMADPVDIFQGFDGVLIGGLSLPSGVDAIEWAVFAAAKASQFDSWTSILGVSIRNNVGLGEGTSNGTVVGGKESTKEELDNFGDGQESEGENEDDQNGLTEGDGESSTQARASLKIQARTSLKDRAFETWSEGEILEASGFK